jgi:glycosyltransferase involved in cell wall biosynthesis
VGDEDLSHEDPRDNHPPPRVSVIVPVRDRRVLLRRTLDALAAQTITDHEVIVVDDGSSDGSDREAEADAARGRPVRLVRNGGSGAVAARTTGVALARADVLAFTDSDCLPDPDWLGAGLAVIDGGADVVQGLTRPVRPPRPLERTVWSTVDDGLFATCNVFYRRQAFDAAGGFDANAGDRLGFRPGSQLRGYGFGEDSLLGWRVRRSGRAAFAPGAVVEHEVFPVDVIDSLKRAWTTGAFPALFREVPELRILMRRDLRAGRRRRAPLYAAAAATAAGRGKLALACVAGWGVLRWRELSAAERSLPRRAKVLPVELALDATRAVALLWGGLRARMPRAH